MINMLKRLAELDAAKSSFITESESVAECGPMGMMDGMASAPSTPASINMSAGSGDELANMLATIMQLAGVKQVGADDLGVVQEPSIMTAVPSLGGEHQPSAGEDMRAVLDKMNDAGGEEDGEEDDEEETDEGEYDNSPADAEPTEPFNANQFANQENQPGVGNRMDGNMPKGRATMEETLMAAYKQFVNE